MTDLETIDRLCGVIEAQAEIIKKQAFYISEVLTVDEAISDMLEAERSDIDDTIDFLKKKMQPVHSKPESYRQVENP
ncbi:MAG: hypothetical protein LUC92_08700 [Clostridiales bacterium]|nr:hypothetical protein [Clostridiales bacterium]